ncbi:hypothetical protein GCM10017744_093830 [Streptomyces antimycoticus]|uniref:Iron ABC transporter permease n=1 Tax=Streptomyces antimycoticus TaxID=68175 RepID=A0A4D4JXZ8_9ACTN|nr:hypothetical protein SANT12839_005920 [Streptomyces antimycoticus]
MLAALLAGAALALAGTLVQAVTRNPLAEPAVLGVSGGAALGAVLLVTTAPVAGAWGMAGAAFAGAAVSCVLAADLLGRTVIAPAQLGAGLMTAVIGTPHFLQLLVRSRR